MDLGPRPWKHNERPTKPSSALEGGADWPINAIFVVFFSVLFFWIYQRGGKGNYSVVNIGLGEQDQLVAECQHCVSPGFGK